jgi:hypothetical protein
VIKELLSVTIFFNTAFLKLSIDSCSHVTQVILKLYLLFLEGEEFVEKEQSVFEVCWEYCSEKLQEARKIGSTRAIKGCKNTLLSTGREHIVGDYIDLRTATIGKDNGARI